MLSHPRETRLYLAREVPEVDLREIAGGQAAIFSVRSPTRTTPNQDAAALVPFGPRAAVLVVADGVGGAQSGAHAAEIVVRAVQAGLAAALDSGRALRGALLDAVESANRAVVDLGVGAATTLAAVALEDGRVRPYHAGDSLILLMGQRGRIKLQTVSHSPVGFAVEAGLLDEREALHHQDRHLVSNVLGSADMRLEIGSARELAERDTLLLASDGLTDNVHLDEIVDLLRAGPLEERVAALAAEARRRMEEPIAGEPSKPDDLTLVAFRRRV